MQGSNYERYKTDRNLKIRQTFRYEGEICLPRQQNRSERNWPALEARDVLRVLLT